MKKITQNLRWLVTLLAMIVCTGAWAETSTVTASKVTSSSASWTGSANETWAVTVNGGATNQNVTNEFAQIGTKNSPSTSITFSTSGISETITKIEVECASYNGIGTVSATVGSEDFGTQEQSIPTWSSNSGGTVTFFGSASGEIVITMTNETGGRAMYIKSITVTYSSSGETPTPTPSITVDPATVNATAEETEGTLAISYENLSISDMTDFDIQYYDANNQELTTEPDWVEVLVAEAEGGENYVVSYVVDANEGKARTAYCKVYAIGDDEYVYSNLITINQAEYVAPSDVVYKKVTSTDDITNGQYLIVYEVNEEGGVAFNGGLTALDASGNIIDVTIENGTIAGTDVTEAAEFTINVTEGSLKSASGYYIGVSSNSNGLKQTEDATTYTNTFSIDNDENAVIAADFTGSNMKLLFNNSGRFRYYSSINQTNKAIQLYKKETTPTVTIGDSKWATYVAEDNVTFPSGVSAYTVETIETDHVTLGEALAVTKGTPILVYSETPGTYTLEVVEEGVCDETFNNKLKVSNGTVTGGANIYALANKDNVVGFYPVASNVTVPAGKAYLDTSSAKNLVKGFLALGGVTDAINNIAVETANGTIFNIAGQKVQNITKGGLYIVNGKKVFVK